jgi:hypothetical protein
MSKFIKIISADKDCAMLKILSAVPTMSDSQLLNLFKNAAQRISKGANADAESALAAVECEWKQRLERARDGEIVAERPSKGMLQELGYKVGENGERTQVRRQILALLLEREVPLVGSPAYTDEWGTPNSPKRYWKLVRFFESQLTNPAHRKMEKATIEWREDLEWVRRNYEHLASLDAAKSVAEREPAEAN